MAAAGGVSCVAWTQKGAPVMYNSVNQYTRAVALSPGFDSVSLSIQATRLAGQSVPEITHIVSSGLLNRNSFNQYTYMPLMLLSPLAVFACMLT